MKKVKDIQVMESSIQMRNDEYIKDGIIYCEKCDEARTLKYEGRTFRVVCKCEREKIEKEEQESLNRKIKIKIDNLKSQSLLGRRYENTTFENTKTGFNKSFDIAFKRTKKYCENYKVVLDRGLGIFLHGASGIGKTHLQACMVNELSNKLQETLLTNFFEISKEIRKTFSNYQNEASFIDKLTNIDFLFIDDFGTEAVKRKGEDNFLQEKIFEIINLRYNNLKPIIFSSNYSLQELITKQGFLQKTIDRIFEMSGAIIEIEGKSFRMKAGGF